MSWKTILVPHDFSASANHAAATARDEAKLHGAKILLLHVIELPGQISQDAAIMPEANGGAPVTVREFATQGAERHLADISARLVKDGAHPQSFIRFGKPSEEIIQFAEENQVDLIVMGTHGRSGLAHLLLGSVTERVVRASKIPVLAVPGGHHE